MQRQSALCSTNLHSPSQTHGMNVAQPLPLAFGQHLIRAMRHHAKNGRDDFQLAWCLMRAAQDGCHVAGPRLGRQVELRRSNTDAVFDLLFTAGGVVGAHVICEHYSALSMLRQFHQHRPYKSLSAVPQGSGAKSCTKMQTKSGWHMWLWGSLRAVLGCNLAK